MLQADGSDLIQLQSDQDGNFHSLTWRPPYEAENLTALLLEPEDPIQFEFQLISTADFGESRLHSSTVGRVLVKDNLLINSGGGLSFDIIDITDPFEPILIQPDNDARSGDIALVGDNLFLTAMHEYQIRSFDLSNPNSVDEITSPNYSSTVGRWGRHTTMELAGNYIYVWCSYV